MSPTSKIVTCLVVLLLATTSSLANAAPISDLVVFGDSLSDVGNNAQPTPYWNGRYSNGPVWVEYLNNSLGLSPLTASSMGGRDYATGGAQTADMVVQAQSYIAGPGVDPNALYVVFGGANDLFNNPSASAIALAVTNLATVIGELAANGARNFLVADLPDLGLTPAASGDPLDASLLTQAFNGALFSALDTLSVADQINITTFDLYGLLDQAAAAPERYGFGNVTDPCIGLSSCDGYLFFDDMHPTTKGHVLLADAALAALPEPAPLVLLLPGLLILLRRKAHAGVGA
ncbi:SGNH/GDSL hydrolase family protein [Telmatospirillum sp.]|uniref:SGNH/GDSL hydrolase family protein n=1 Tax=Telmatospirillum sp. TaxID=2079197 RepID=UPI002848ABED|nr:SGNH/GDSL hydrolase family protein [Telmatospirillum sp.]MDR3437655.1 SGNH/GDSL hydrolase family protein [Telmatospirillum sp.]